MGRNSKMKAIYTDLNTGKVVKEVQYNAPRKSDCDEYINEYEYAMAENQILGIINELYKIGYRDYLDMRKISDIVAEEGAISLLLI